MLFRDCSSANSPKKGRVNLFLKWDAAPSLVIAYVAVAEVQLPSSTARYCEKKSDVLRLLCCPFNLDNGDEHDSALSCLCGGKGEEPCCDCGQLKRLHRNHRYEALLCAS
jgi:hypothetical protein